MMFWTERAACRDEDPELFFPAQSDVVGAEVAAEVCAGCDVVPQCALNTLLMRPLPTEGVWAGIAVHRVPMRYLLRYLRQRAAGGQDPDTIAAAEKDAGRPHRRKPRGLPCVTGS